MIQFKPQKAKTYGKDKIKDLSGPWYISKKYDGHQVFIVKQSKSVRFFTSQWKEFNIEAIREPLSRLEEDFVLIGEYLYGCDGKLGSRSLSSKLTTFRTNFKKGITNSEEDESLSKIMVFDLLPVSHNNLITSMRFVDRFLYLWNMRLPKKIHKVYHTFVSNFEDCIVKADKLVSKGWEGAMLIDPYSIYNAGKRVHHAIKLKGRHTADLLCVGVEEGQGKYEGLIGSLLLKDSKGREVSVGSGLSDYDRALQPSDFVGKVIEIEYERIDTTYIQPTFKSIREDKSIEEIN